MKRVVLLLTVVTVLLGGALAAFAAVPPMINYQGKLLKPDGTAVADGTYAMTFAIYTQPTGGLPVWSEQNPNVQLKKGLFSVLLGSVFNLPANVFDGPDRYFGVTVGTDAEMAPRQQITTSAFAFKAAVADTATTVVDGAITSAKLADGAVTGAKITDGAVTTGKIAQAEPWQVATLLNGWQPYGVGYGDSIRFYKDQLGIVHIDGLVIPGTAGTTFFTLPTGYRPLRELIFAQAVYVGAPIGGRVDVFPDGQVKLVGENGGVDWISLSGISFRAEQ